MWGKESFVFCLSVGVLLGACQPVPQDPSGEGGAAVAPGGGEGHVVVAHLSGLASEEECPNGGVTLDYGVDVNGDGLLQGDEVTRTYVLCHGKDGVVPEVGLDVADLDTRVLALETLVASMQELIDAQAAAIESNSVKVGISEVQAAAIEANAAKVGLSEAQAAAIEANTGKVGVTAAQAAAIEANTGKVGIRAEQGVAIEVNTSRLESLPDFTGWDQNAADDFDGDYTGLSNKPLTITADQIAALEAGTVANQSQDEKIAGNSAALAVLPSFEGWDKDAADDFSGGYGELLDRPLTITEEERGSIASNAVAILGLPSFEGWDQNVLDDFDGEYASLGGRPVLFSGAYGELLDRPLTITEEERGSIASSAAAISVLPTFDGWDQNVSDDFDGEYASLGGRPVLFSGSYGDLLNRPLTITGKERGSIASNTAKLSSLPTFEGWDQNASDDFDGEYASLGGKPVLFSGSYGDLLDRPLTISEEERGSIASSAAALSALPVFDGWDQNASDDFDGEYASLGGKPVLFSGSYGDLLDRPLTISEEERGSIASSAAALLALPVFDGWDQNGSDDFDGEYASLGGKPALFSGSYGDLLDRPLTISEEERGSIASSAAALLALPVFDGWDQNASDDFDGEYASLGGKPVLFSGSYGDLLDRPLTISEDERGSIASSAAALSVLPVFDGWDQNASDDFDGDYASLGGKPVLFSGSYGDLLDRPLTISEEERGSIASSAAALLALPVFDGWDQNGSDDFDGEYASLGGKPVLFSGSYGDLLDRPLTISEAERGSIASSAAALLALPVFDGWDQNASDDFDGEYVSLGGRPVLFSGSYGDLLDRPLTISEEERGSIASSAAALSALPVFDGWDQNGSDDFDGEYASLGGKPVLFSGSYSDLLARPSTITEEERAAISANTGDLLDLPDFEGWDKSASDDFSGDYVDLTNRPSMISGATVSEAEVEAYITNGPLNLAPGTTLGGVPISTGDHTEDTDTWLSDEEVGEIVASYGYATEAWVSNTCTTEAWVLEQGYGSAQGVAGNAAGLAAMDVSRFACAQGYAGEGCVYSDVQDCNGGGVVGGDGGCTCAAGYAGASCEYSSATTCKGNGTLRGDGSCVCLTGYAGSRCEYSDAVACNGNGAVGDNGACSCSSGYYGKGCLYTSSDCSNNGTPGIGGVCTCYPGYAGQACGECASGELNDKQNCGRCGVSCDADQSCLGGMCTEDCVGGWRGGAYVASNNVELSGPESDKEDCVLQPGDEGYGAVRYVTYGADGICYYKELSGEMEVDTRTQYLGDRACELTSYDPDCDEDETFCDNTCVSLSDDTQNCGSCGVVCESGTCIDGGCKVYAATLGEFAFEGDWKTRGLSCEDDYTGSVLCTPQRLELAAEAGELEGLTDPAGKRINHWWLRGAENSVGGSSPNCREWSATTPSTDLCVMMPVPFGDPMKVCSSMQNSGGVFFVADDGSGDVDLDVQCDQAHYVGCCYPDSNDSVSCASGETLCSGECRNTGGDEFNCGGCGSLCASGESCVNGACEAACGSGQTDCGGTCVTGTDVDLSTCGWSNWSYYGACSNQCGSGTKTRTRTCSTGSAGSAHCAGSATGSAACYISTSTTCGWSAYGSWGPWSTTCGVAQRSRSRGCLTGVAGTASCAGSVTETETSDQGSSTCGWSAYGAFGSWSTSCGSATRSQTRTCTTGSAGSSHCSGSSTNTESSSQGSSTCGWSGYGSFSGWSTSCGSATRSQIRTCTTGSAGSSHCSGSSTNTESSSQGSSTCGWGGWSGYGSCSTSCGSGTKTRARSCGVSGHCSGSSSESVACEAGISSCGWGGWGSWGSCSSSCGNGTQSRSRFCSVSSHCSGSGTQSQGCTGGSSTCGWKAYGAFSSWSTTCGPATRSQTRTCTTGSAGSTHCVGSSTNTESSDQGSTTCGWSGYGSWSSWSTNCGSGTRTRNRTCSTGKVGSGHCVGSQKETQSGDQGSTTCGWGSWSSWSACSTSCGTGSKTRGRTCYVSGHCGGSAEEESSCSDYSGCWFPSGGLF